jgi:hypothetical protein
VHDPSNFLDKGRKWIVVKGFKNPSFSDRANASAAAKSALLERFKAAPKTPDPAQVAAAKERRLAREAAREQAAAAKQAAARAAEEVAAAETQAADDAAKATAEAARAAQPRMPTQAELKAARDERYAARKARKR